jgi:hypothetical protein
VRTAVPMAAIWTGMLLLVSLLHLNEFDYSRPPVWFWFGAYIVFPLIAFALMWKHRDDEPAPEIRNLPKWVRGTLLFLGILFSFVGFSLFFMPTVMSTLWPWKVTTLLLQLYSAPFLAYGIGSVQMASQDQWTEIRIGVVAAFVFSACVLIASILHRALFSRADISDWIWFIVFSLLTLVFGLISLKALQPHPSEVKLS